MENKIDITSTALEKGLDLAKDFLDKLVMPAVEETGLLLKDQVTLWKFKNQIKMLNKAKDYCEKNKISPKQISLKLLCPLLEYSGIEDDELLHDKWAILLSNLVDSNQNIENQVFPYILSQISRNEFSILEKVFDQKQARISKLTRELDDFKLKKPKLILDISNNIEEIENKISETREGIQFHTNTKIMELQEQKRKLSTKLNSLNYKEAVISSRIKEHQTVPNNGLKEFELSNLIRLGVVKELKEISAYAPTLDIPYNPDPMSEDTHFKVDLDIEMDEETKSCLTELGELFINGCKERMKQNY